MPRRRTSSQSNPCRDFGHKPYPIPATQVLVAECAREIMEVETDDTDMVQRIDNHCKALTQIESSDPTPAALLAWEAHVKAGHQPKRADCPECQEADGVRIAHKTTSDEHRAMIVGTFYLDVGHMHAADLSGRKHFASATIRLAVPSGKTMVLPWFEPLTNGKEVVKVIHRIVTSLPALRPLRLLH
eukprot:3193288-Amphidinium_carterae.1